MSDQDCSRPPPFRHGKTVAQLPQDIMEATHVFVRVDKVTPPLTPPYEGPYEVAARHPKYFVIFRKGREDKVSIDRLKPARFIPELELPLSDNSNNVFAQDVAGHSFGSTIDTTALPGDQTLRETPPHRFGRHRQSDDPPATPEAPVRYTTRCGRSVRPPVRFADNYISNIRLYALDNPSSGQAVDVPRPHLEGSIVATTGRPKLTALASPSSAPHLPLPLVRDYSVHF